VGGGYFGWRAAFPIAFRYLLGLSGTLGAQDIAIKPTVMMGDYITFVTRMLVAFGLMFEIPLVVFFLSIAGVVNYLHLIHYGRWFVVVAFAIAAVFTPPDIASQLMMAIPMIVLYGSSILLAWIFGRRPSQAQRDAYAARKRRKRERREAEAKRK
jgi:sec-independent protein translocase protein TatC